VVKVPASAIAAGQELTFTMNVAGNYTSEKAYYYYADSSHQRLLYGKTETTNETVNASITLRIRHYNDSYKVKISKTDVTQTKEVAGATLVLKDSTGKVVDTWVSTNTSHEITLATGEYSLTETIAPNGYKLSTTTINFLVNQDGTLYEKVNGKYQLVSKINMINELLDTVTIAKKDSKTGNYVSGAVLVIKDASGNVVSEFTTTDTVYQLSLNAGVYTLTEKTAPNGYVLSSEVITFKITNDGTLQIKNSNGDYEDTAIITFLNTPKKTETVKVPSTGKNATIMIMAGIALLIAGVVYVKKTTKEC
ncbi:MAG TPA: SpaA isopeptide-forming pilin-related protein, partial [Bacilli bacterium]|nr:SpaA isopeptide-forming pilin-related protein [Bacilli bacterium]